MGKIVEQEIITPIATSFMTQIVPDLTYKAFQVYEKNGFGTGKKYFQKAEKEHSHAAAAIALSVSAIEAYRNRICYLENKELGHRRVPISINQIIATNCQKECDDKQVHFPEQRFLDLSDELFAIRDTIMHSHIYRIIARHDRKDWSLIKYSSQKMPGYGDAKFDRVVDSRLKRTKILELNVQPSLIGFEELFKVLLVFDLFTGIVKNTCTPNSINLMINVNFGRPNVLDTLSPFLTYYYDKILPNNDVFTKFINKLSKTLRKDFEHFLSKDGICFITNTCPKCSSLGFKKLDGNCQCNSCGSYIGMKPPDAIEPRS